MTIVERAHLVAQETEHLIDHVRVAKAPLNEEYLKVEGHLTQLISELASHALLDVSIILCPSDVTSLPEGRAALTKLRDCLSPREVVQHVKGLSQFSL